MFLPFSLSQIIENMILVGRLTDVFLMRFDALFARVFGILKLAIGNSRASGVVLRMSSGMEIAPPGPLLPLWTFGRNSRQGRMGFLLGRSGLYCWGLRWREILGA